MNLWMYEIYFVGWTEMCSRHGDTAKFEYEWSWILFFWINLFDQRLAGWDNDVIKITATLCRWKGAWRFVSV